MNVSPGSRRPRRASLDLIHDLSDETKHDPVSMLDQNALAGNVAVKSVGLAQPSPSLAGPWQGTPASSRSFVEWGAPP